MLESRPYISTDHTEAMETSADMYYDREWRYPETEPQKYKYVFGKSAGTHITARHVVREPHEYYAIPIDRGDEINRRRMPDYVPRARGPAGTEAARQLREEREAATRSSRRPEPIKDIPPHTE